MCVVSNIADDWTRRFDGRWPMIPNPVAPKDTDEFTWTGFTGPIDLSKYATKEDLEKLRKEIEELKLLIVQAQKFDEATGQPNCDSPDKFKLLKLLAKELNIDLSDLKLNE